MEKLGITVFDVAVIAVAVFGAADRHVGGLCPCRPVHRLVDRRRLARAGAIAKLIQPEVEKLVRQHRARLFRAPCWWSSSAALIVLVMLTNALSALDPVEPAAASPTASWARGFGVLCAWVAMGTAFLFYSYLGPRQLPPAVEGGATFPLIKDMANFVEPYLPPGFRTRLSGRGSTDTGSSSHAVVAGRRAVTGRQTAAGLPKPPDAPKPPQ